MIRLCLKPTSGTVRTLMKPHARNFHWRRIADQINHSLDGVLGRVPHKFVPVVLVGANLISFFMFLRSNREHGSKLPYNSLVANFLNPGPLILGINSYVMYSLARHMEMMYGPTALLKIVLLSLALGTWAHTYMREKQGRIGFLGNDAIIQGLAYTLILRNPYASFYFLPFPFPLRAWLVGVIGFIFDAMSMNLPAFGGIGAGLVASKLFI